MDLVIDVSKSKKWKGIVWHHSAGPDSKGRDWQALVRYHTSYRVDYNIVSKEEFERRAKSGEGKSFQHPWLAVGYHGGVEWVEGQMVFNWGRPLSMAGAHAGVKGASNAFNEEYLGLCAIGNFDLVPPRTETWKFCLDLTKTLMQTFSIPKTHVIGHREVYDMLGVPRQKSCPGKYWDMELFRTEL